MEPNHILNSFINSIIHDLKSLSNSLRPLSRQSADANNAIINKLLLGTDRDCLQILKDIMGHLLHVVDFKGVSVYLLNILAKLISFVKMLEEHQKDIARLFTEEVYREEMTSILYHIIDILSLFLNKHKEVDMALRVIQTTFSLIDYRLLRHANEHLLIRIYSVCLDCCLAHAMVRNISVSALFALTEVVFSHGNLSASSSILQQLMQYLLKGKKFSWIRDVTLKGLAWDLSIVAVRNLPFAHFENLSTHPSLPKLFQEMYEVAMRKVFIREELRKPKAPHRSSKTEREKFQDPCKELQQEFIRYYRTFIFLSIHLDLRRVSGTEMVPFRQNIHLFKIVYELQRDSRLYLFLEGISLLLIEGSHLLVEDDRIILLLEILKKVVEELCLSNLPLQIASDSKDLHLQKTCGDLSPISDIDIVRLIRNSIFKLRKKLEGRIDLSVRTGELLTERTTLVEKGEAEDCMANGAGLRNRWQRLINNVLQVIRYLTSLNMQDSTNEQAVRKLILQLQYWYLICPSTRTRNLILQQLLNASTFIDSKLQAIKVSQCVQIGSNIIYGYYDSLDTIGLTTILKMMARVKTTWEDGKGFEELDEVCSMSEKLYLEQNLVTNEKSFSKTIQAFVACLNGILGEFQQSPREDRSKRVGRNPVEKLLKMTDYIFTKMLRILEQNSSYIQNQWNYLTGFWTSLCCSDLPQMKRTTMNHLSSVILILLGKADIRQEVLLSTYLELAKLRSPETSFLVVRQIKQVLPSLNRQEAIIEAFRIIRIMVESKPSTELAQQIYQLEEMVIKEALFRVTSVDKLCFIVESLSCLSESKNEQYKTVNLIWTISDHVKLLVAKGQLQEKEGVWRQLFNKLYWLGLHSIHGETKQSCMHTFTQILAESTTILGKTTSTVIIQEIYLELFFVLMNLSPQSPKVAGTGLPEMVKVAIKNFAKFIKKCISHQISNTQHYLDLTLLRLRQNLPKLSPQEVTPEYLFEVCALFDFYKSLQSSSNHEEKAIAPKASEVLLCIEVVQVFHQHLDHTTLFWRKKYEPTFQQIRKFFSQ